jgi:hypothetical protein
MWYFIVTDIKFKVNFPTVITLELSLFIKTQFATDSQNVLHCNQRTRLITDSLTISKVPERLQMVWQA